MPKALHMLHRSMTLLFHMMLAIAAMFVNSTQAASDFTQEHLNTLAEQLDVQYKVISNVDVPDCETLFNSNCFLATLTLQSGHAVAHPELAIFFSHIAPIAWDDYDAADIEHLNGDLHRLVLPANALNSNDDVVIAFKAKFWHVSQSDVMPNYYIVADGLEPAIVSSTTPTVDVATGLQKLSHVMPFETLEQTKRGEGDVLPIADGQWRYDYYQSLTTDAEDQAWRIIPKVSQASYQETVLSLANGIAIQSDSYQTNAVVLGLFHPVSTASSPVTVNIEITGGVDTRYDINIEDSVIKIVASNSAAVDYALVTLAKMQNSQHQVPLAQIVDKPRYEYRGMHLDLARNFMGKSQILSILDEMFILKLNKLHLHLADDEGWRLEVPSLPELTDIGAFRCHDLSETRCLLPQLGSGPSKDSPVNGYLSSQDYLDILSYAKQRHIDVIPSFDMPGHARAAVKAMEARYQRLMAAEQSEAAEEFLLSDLADTTEYLSVQFYRDNTVNPCQESTYHFLDTVISYVQRLHRQAGLPLHTYHIGADETAGAWIQSPVCQAFVENNEALSSIADLKPYFLKRLANLVNQKGIQVAGWSDGMHTLVSDPEFQGQQVNVWDTLYWQGHKIADEFARAKWQTVLSVPDVTYFDFPYLNNPKETGYYWASKQTDSFKVFQFQPEHLSLLDGYWLDRMGNPYQAEPLPSGRPAFAGIQAQIWTEAVRNNATVQYLIFPRLHAFAERAWHKASWQGQSSSDATMVAQKQDWQGFSVALHDKYLADLVARQPGFRLPPPGIKIFDDRVHANSLWPMLQIDYQDLDGRWHLYRDALPSNKVKAFRTRLKGTDKVSQSVFL